MKTSCFKYYRGDMGVAICIYPPAGWDGMQFPALAPDRQTFYAIKNGSITQEQYEKLYRENTLARLDPREVYNMFKNNVLLCWETPVLDNNRNIINKGAGFCHRHIISHWIWENLKIEVREWSPLDEKIKTSTNPLF